MKHELIELTKWPTMPAPMQSSDEGEAWVWGDFFATLQRKPLLVGHAMQAMLGKEVTKMAMEYPFAMTVFYNKAKNPHGPSSRPVLCVGLEQADYGALTALLGAEAAKLPQVKQGAKGPVMIGVFTAGGRSNLGEFDNMVSADSARQCFFDVIRSQLGLTGDPIRIGTIKDVYGHPDTGWPADTGPSKALKKSGCLVAIAALAALVIVICWL